MTHELRKVGLKATQQYPIKVIYDDVEVGDYMADIVVEDSIIIELKAVKALDNIHRAQCLNYLRATKLSVCLLVNFGAPKIEIRHIVFDF